MKLLSIKLGDKTYMSGKITTFLTREALKLQKEALKLGESAKKMVDNINEAQAQKSWTRWTVYSAGKYG